MVSIRDKLEQEAAKKYSQPSSDVAGSLLGEELPPTRKRLC